MGRHSAQDDDEVDADTQGGVAVGDDTRDDTRNGTAGGYATPGRGGRHSSERDEPGDDADTGGLSVIEDALADPVSEPMPTAEGPWHSEQSDHAGAQLHDAPTQRIPVIAAEPAWERTDRIPSIAGSTEPDGETAAPQDADGLEGGVYEVGVEATGPVFATTQAPTQAPAPASTPGRGAAGDLRLIRRHGDVRARVIAAVVVPFVVYFVVFAVTGALTVRSLIWIWVPAVTAGVLVGLLLDAGHRRYPDSGSTAATEPEGPSTAPRTR